MLVTSTAVIPIEFKVGAKKFQQADYEQAWDYGLDLKNFHAPSHAAPIFPILCATEAPKSDRRWKPPHADGVRPPFCCNGPGLGTAIALALDEAGTASAPITPSTWGTGSYSPTPTIIEAARSLYARHTVHDITRSDAGAVNLAVTSAAVERIIAGARERRRKAIVFVTGVPGAGKTLVGLNVATRHGSRDDAAHAVFLSGNGPLVAVLREALARDDLDRAKLTDPRARIGTSRTAVRAFIQNVHHFRDATLRDPAAPADHVVVFDEAQRAWDARNGRTMRRCRSWKPLAFPRSTKWKRPGGLFHVKAVGLLHEAEEGAAGVHTDGAGATHRRDGAACRLGGGGVSRGGRSGDQHGRGGYQRLARRRPHAFCQLGRLHFAASHRLRVCGLGRARAAFRVAGRRRAGHVRAGVAPGHLDAFIPLGNPLPLREGSPRRRGGARPRALRGVSRPLSDRAHAEHAGGAAVDPPAAAGHGAGRPRGLLVRPAAQTPRDRHPGEHRPGALVFEPAARHPLIAVSGGRGDGVSGAGAGARLDEKSRGTPTSAGVGATGAITVFAGRSGPT